MIEIGILVVTFLFLNFRSENRMSRSIKKNFDN